MTDVFSVSVGAPAARKWTCSRVFGISVYVALTAVALLSVPNMIWVMGLLFSGQYSVVSSPIAVRGRYAVVCPAVRPLSAVMPLQIVSEIATIFRRLPRSAKLAMGNPAKV